MSELPIFDSESYIRLSDREKGVVCGVLQTGQSPGLERAFDFWMSEVRSYLVKNPGSKININLGFKVDPRDQFVHRVAIRSHLCDGIGESDLIQDAKDGDAVLDVLDAALSILFEMGADQSLADSLDVLLFDVPHIYGVNASRTGLAWRHSAAMQSQYAFAVSVQDKASGLFGQAWSAAFSKNPDPSLACALATKSVEALLGPLVLPKDPGPTYGNIKCAIKQDIDSSKKTKYGFSGPGGIEAFYGVLSEVFPYADDRHGHGDAPSLRMAQAEVYQLATLFGWVRLGCFTSSVAVS